jgi:hypothetical protein
MVINAESNYYVKRNGQDRLGITDTDTTLMAGRNLVLKSNKNSTEQVWSFNSNGSVTFPDNTVQTTAYTGTVAFSNVTGVPALGISTATVNTLIANSLTTLTSLSVNGNVTATKFIGDGSSLTNITLSQAGNIIGTQTNVTLIAGTSTYTFDNTGTLTLPANGDIVMPGANANLIAGGTVFASKFASYTGNWTLAIGANSVNFSVPGPGTYKLWVNGNVPNGIVTYIADVVVTNQNVPVLGTSYGWYYSAGNALVLTAIPNQIVGTANGISSATVTTTTSWTFAFGITNNSTGTQTVSHGYTRLG